MARTRGSKNQDYAVERMRLAGRVREFVAGDGSVSSSLREMAAAARTSVATLKHYFKNRQGVLAGALESIQMESAPHIAEASMVFEKNVRRSLKNTLHDFAQGWVRHRVGRFIGFGLAAGLSERSLGPVFVERILEPTLQLMELKLRRHAELGAIAIRDCRHASLALLGPIFLALLHQHELSGASCRPLDIEGLIDQHVNAFLRAWPAL
jgi:AcrR family transcriptional regulator